jgi:phage-related protein
MATALVLTDKISQGSQKKVTYRVLKAQFGNGYEQTAPDGLNYSVESWDVKYENITLADRTTLIAMLESVGSFNTISWTPPNGTAKLYKMTQDGYTESQQSANVFSVSFSLYQVFA